MSRLFFSGSTRKTYTCKRDSPSLRVWQPMLVGLYRLLARHGAFRDVRWWRLSTDRNGRPVFGKHAADSQPRAPQELLHPEGRRLVIVISDCASPSWYDPRILDPWLRLWGQRQPLALLHLLPPHYWSRGGLGRANFTQFRALAPGHRMCGSFRTKLDCRPMFFTCRCSRWNRNRWRSGRACWPARVNSMPWGDSRQYRHDLRDSPKISGTSYGDGR